MFQGATQDHKASHIERIINFSQLLLLGRQGRSQGLIRLPPWTQNHLQNCAPEMNMSRICEKSPMPHTHAHTHWATRDK